jgi:drug/metabolite transporter (DMT)-like permease
VVATLVGGGVRGQAFPLFFLSGVIGFGVGDVALFQALPRLGSRLTILLAQCLAAPLAALCEWLWLGTRLSGPEMLCGAVVLAGVAVALAPGQHLALTRRTLIIGSLFGFLAAFGQGFGAVLSRKAFDVARLAGENPDGLTAAYQRSLGGLIFGGLCLLVVKRHWIGRFATRSSGEPDLAGRADKWRGAWRWVLLNAVTGPALGVSCYQWGLKVAPTGVVLTIVAITPLVIIPLAARVEGEKPGRRSLMGGILAVLGAVGLALTRSQ